MGGKKPLIVCACIYVYVKNLIIKPSEIPHNILNMTPDTKQLLLVHFFLIFLNLLLLPSLVCHQKHAQIWQSALDCVIAAGIHPRRMRQTTCECWTMMMCAVPLSLQHPLLLLCMLQAAAIGSSLSRPRAPAVVVVVVLFFHISVLFHVSSQCSSASLF